MKMAEKASISIGNPLKEIYSLKKDQTSLKFHGGALLHLRLTTILL